MWYNEIIGEKWRKDVRWYFVNLFFYYLEKCDFISLWGSYKEIVKISKFFKEKSRERNLFGIINNEFRRIFKKSFEM